MTTIRHARTTISILQKDYPYMKYNKDNDILVLSYDMSYGNNGAIRCEHPTNVCLMMEKYGNWIMAWSIRDQPFLYLYESTHITDNMRTALDILHKRWPNASYS